MTTVRPVFIGRGDQDRAVAQLVERLGGAAAAGLNSSFYVARADQTVVTTTSRDAPLARALRERGWAEPRDET